MKRIAGLVICLAAGWLLAAEAADTKSDIGLHPAPQRVEWGAGRVHLNVQSIAGTVASADAAAVALLRELLAGTGRQSGGVKILIGQRDHPALADYITSVPKKSGAYRIVAKPDLVVLAGHDARGTFYAVRTLAQLIATNGHQITLPAVDIVDWPAVPNRGVVEGFYGTPWSHAKRLSLIRFLGENKLDTYIYGPKDDPFHSSPNWRKPYPDVEAGRLRELVNACRAQHVNFVWAVHPGKDIHWTDADFAAVLGKFEAMYALGVRSFAVFFDDISGEGTKADQQARLLNYLHAKFVVKTGDVTPLVVCPTQYNRAWSGGDYLDVLGERLHPSIHVMWTGDRVVSDLTRPAMDWINRRLKRDAYIWWNFPVSDYVRNHLLLGPAYGNAPDIGPLYGGFVSNPMERSEASKVALYGVAEYTWNPPACNANAAWRAAIRTVMPGAPEAFETFCAHNSDLGPNGHGYRREESVAFAPVAEKVLANLRAEKACDVTPLSAEFARIAAAPAAIRAGADNLLLLEEIGPWLDAFEQLGRAGMAVVDAHSALAKGDSAESWRLLAAAHAALERMAEIDRTQNRNPFQPGVKTGSLVITPLVREIVALTDGRLLAHLGGHPAIQLHAITSTAEHDSLPRMLDGREDTYFYCREMQKAGDWFGVYLGGAREVRRVRITQGRDDGDHDRVHMGVIEGLAETGWRELGKVTGPRIDLTLHPPLQLSQVRLRVTKAGKADGTKNDLWTAIREFEINPENAAELCTDVPAFAAQPVRRVEGAFSVAPMLEVHPFTPGKSLALLFPEPRDVRRFEVDLKVNEPARHFVLEGQTAGGGWETLAATVNGTRLVVEPKQPLRAVRVRNQGGETPDVTLAIFTVTAAEGNASDAEILSDGSFQRFARIGAQSLTLPVVRAATEAVFLFARESAPLEVTAHTPQGELSLGKLSGPLARRSLPANTRALGLKPAEAEAQLYEVIAVTR